MKGVKVKLITKPNPNLFGGGIEKITEENPYVLRHKEKRGYELLPQYPVSLENGHTYTLQLKSDGILTNSTVCDTHKDFLVYVTDSGYFNYVRLLLMDQTIALGNSEHVFTFVWNKPSLVAYLRLDTMSDGVVENVIKFWDFKLEEGGQQTDIER